MIAKGKKEALGQRRRRDALDQVEGLERQFREECDAAAKALMLGRRRPLEMEGESHDLNGREVYLRSVSREGEVTYTDPEFEGDDDYEDETSSVSEFDSPLEVLINISHALDEEEGGRQI